MVEADLWPNRIAACKAAGIPVALLNARLSSRSEKRFRMVRPFTAPFFNQLNLITLTDPGDVARWISLGVNEGLLHLTGNIKHDTLISAGTIPESDPSDAILLAASTHADEEREIAAAWLTLRKDFPRLRLIIAPRHAERRSEVRTALESIGISCRLRSEGAELSDMPLLLDTTGELSRLYPKATVVFVGKSLSLSVNHGGQNMIEPLQAGAPVLIGPHTDNFEPLATQLCEAGATIRVNDHREIVDAALSLLGNDAKRSSMITAATAVLQPHQGAVERNCDLVEGLMGGSPLHPG